MGSQASCPSAPATWKRSISAEAAQQRVDAIIAASQDASRAYLAEVDSIASANKALVDSTKAAVKSIVGAREAYVRELSRAVEESRQLVRASEERIGSLRIESDDKGFARSIPGLDDAAQAQSLLERSRTLAEQAARDLSQAADSDSIRLALQSFDRAERAGDQAEAISLRLKNRELENRAVANLNTLTQRQIEAEQALQRIQEERRRGLEAERDQQEKLTERLREQTKILLENVGLFDGDGKPLAADQQAERLQKQRDALKEISSLALTEKDFNAASALGLAKFVTEMERELARSPIKLEFDVTEGIAKIEGQLKSAFEKFKPDVPFDADRLEQFLGRPVSSAPDAFAGLNALKAERDQLEKAIADAPDLRRQADKLRNEAALSLDSTKTTGRAVSRGLGVLFGDIWQFGSNTEQAAEKLSKLQSAVERLSKSPTIPDAELKKAFALLSSLKGLTEGFAGNPGFVRDVEALSDAMLRLKELQGVNSKLQERGADALGACRSDPANALPQSGSLRHSDVENASTQFPVLVRAAIRWTGTETPSITAHERKTWLWPLAR